MAEPGDWRLLHCRCQLSFWCRRTPVFLELVRLVDDGHRLRSAGSWSALGEGFGHKSGKNPVLRVGRSGIGYGCRVRSSVAGLIVGRAKREENATR